MTKDEVDKLLKSTGMNLIETHISWVLLASEYVYKIKKPLKYPFLDFTTLSSRRKYCRNEVKLNSRFSDIYLDVVPVRLEKGNIRIGGEGKTIEYAVKMRKMQNAKRMDHLLRKRKVEKEDILKLASKVADFHRGALIVKPKFSKRELKKTFNDINTVKGWIDVSLGKKWSSATDSMIARSNKFIDMHSALMRERIEKGYYRDVHGDLHSRNIFLYSDPVIFDCIEFNDSFRQIDVLNEVAFFTMDLEAHGRKDLGDLFMERYTELFPCMETKEEAMLFNYYKCFRANVRAKVNALRAMQSDNEKEIKEYSTEVKSYLDMIRSLFR